MKFFVVGRVADHRRVSLIERDLESLGHDVTYDWPAALLPAAPPNATRRAEALLSLRGVRTADAVVCMYHRDLRGSRWEMGAALAQGIPVIVLGYQPDPDLFYTLTHRANDLSEAISIARSCALR